MLGLLATGEAFRFKVATTRAEVPNLTSALKRAVHRLSVLVGVSPGELAGQWLEALPVPAGPSDVPAGVPSDLLRAPAGHPPRRARAGRGHGPDRRRHGGSLPAFLLDRAVDVQSVAASLAQANRFR
jgi:hypothetical protein